MTKIITVVQLISDIVISPVVLESVQRMFESLTPTFQSLHPIGVVNHLHSQSLDRVESKNTLMKKEKSLDLQEKLLETIKEPIKEKHHKKKSEAESEMLRTFEKSVSSFVQASLHLPRINFLCLQASVVEEMRAFSGNLFFKPFEFPPRMIKTAIIISLNRFFFFKAGFLKF